VDDTRQSAAHVAHDFNNLLSTILGYTTLLLDSVQDRPDLVADLLEIKRAAERASELTRQLLESAPIPDDRR
jgi:signal transduction histidine kinase